MNSYKLAKAEIEIQRLVDRIARMAGMDHKIEVFSTDAPRACSITFKENSSEFQKPIITYNPVFIEQIATVNPWAIVAVFTHEVAFYHNNDLYKKYIDQYSDNKIIYRARTKEIRVDNFTGWVLWHEGARLKEASALYSLPKYSDPYSTDPAKNGRKRAMRFGWIKAHSKTAPLPKRKPKQDPPSDNNETGSSQSDFTDPNN